MAEIENDILEQEISGRILKSPDDVTCIPDAESLRLLIVSSRAKSLKLISKIFLPNVTMIQYSYENDGLNDIVGAVDDADGLQANMLSGELYFDFGLLSPGKLKANPATLSYEKIRTVGKGAFGSAVLYRRKDDDSLVIIKEINMHDLNAKNRQMALNEVTVLSKLEHPNIVSYYDSFEEDGLLMIEMEYAEKGNLSQYLSKRDKPLEEREILCKFHQMVSAVKYLHENNIIHRYGISELLQMQ
uniref:Protein kinase domain-containing protein n=1 Tax=Romanomermis culicivorax TaxID=13658 RepID=A0A915IFI9_ROMCU